MPSPPPAHNSVLPSALNIPLFNKLRNKRIILASSSPRRLEILRAYGLGPEVVKSEFPEELNHGDFDNPGDYTVATATEKVSGRRGRESVNEEGYMEWGEADILFFESPDDPPDLVIGADTVVVLGSEASYSILEKPRSTADQMGMLTDFNGSKVDVITAVTLVQPQLANPGYSLQSLVQSTKVNFAHNSPQLIKAYVECGEGIDRAGGFAVQGLGGMLIKGIEGDYNNVVGFPGQAFFEWLSTLADEETLCEMD
ncbi:BZ3500_MvSof-1268-A1-R1_Chr2-2g05145 [Microbotryum saponariae]|uniref:BZ3500_MvSof-1268-A1-R1_Chr2-2g05145 protein n=1 Tax=Microbotryum saponariae TaxID=289078 RepID=A0A2X0N1V1_9BASI|nr:BZ3500_MvSof-1268-A1-R1_Chr2-2g05145 [Microbotryum saponariae]SDA00972.1 BZ3501_MvSof-1269-A2-R1_Chr2-2g04819 [Microbotryum saponariae]